MKPMFKTFAVLCALLSLTAKASATKNKVCDIDMDSSYAEVKKSGQEPPQWKAQWIGIGYTEDINIKPAQYFQKTFPCTQKIKKATLHITAHGLYEASIGDKRIGNAYLTPGWTEYNKRLEYQSYDVTGMLKKGDNTVTVSVGNGWYRGVFGFEMHDFYGKELALLAQLEITYADGKKEIIGTDASWKCGTGPVQANSINHGEMVNGNKSITCDKPVTIANIGYDKLVADTSVHVTKHESFKPVKVITTPKGETVLDFGQNLVGWVVVNASGKKGDSIHLLHAEVLDKAGNFYMDNMRTAKVKASYILTGKKQLYEPHFTYFGFRYVKVMGGTGTIIPDDFTAVALYADMKPSGTFECSNPMLNKLQQNIVWGQRGNFLCIPTDCPQRDERLGWTGDAQVFSRTAAFNYDVNQYLSHWLADLALNQLPNGSVPHVIPDVLNGAGGSTGWADSSTIIPWTLYEVYGNKQILETQYPSMKAWVEFMRKGSNNNLWNTSWHFGDWLSYRDPQDDGTDAITNKQEIAQCFYAHSTQLLINAATVLNKKDDVAFYTSLLEKIKEAYRHEYITGSGRLLSDTQTAYVLALHFDMLPEGNRAAAAKYLADNIHNYKDHLTTGFLGTPYLCHVLSRFGYTDLAYTLLLQDTFPSWLYPVKMGATTIWERWDGIKTDGSFQTTYMNSFNHYAYGAIGDWMYQNIAGIQLGSPGYKDIVIKPVPGGGLTWCKASYDCPNGKIAVDWKLNAGKLVLDVTIPKGSTATLMLPNGKAKQVSSGTHHFEG
jgi:alpha-L-rhamnosidase